MVHFQISQSTNFPQFFTSMGKGKGCFTQPQKMKFNSKNNCHFFINGSTCFPEKRGICIFTQEETGIMKSSWSLDSQNPSCRCHHCIGKPEQAISGNVILGWLNVCRRYRKSLGLFSSSAIWRIT